MIDTIKKLKDSVILKKLKEEVIRSKKFQLVLAGNSTEIIVSDKDIKNYVKFILKDGEMGEKRSLLESLESNFIIQNKKVYIN